MRLNSIKIETNDRSPLKWKSAPRNFFFHRTPTCRIFTAPLSVSPIIIATCSVPPGIYKLNRAVSRSDYFHPRCNRLPLMISFGKWDTGSKKGIRKIRSGRTREGGRIKQATASIASPLIFRCYLLKGIFSPRDEERIKTLSRWIANNFIR